MFGGGDAGWAKVKQLIANTRVLNRSSLVFQGVGNGEYRARHLARVRRLRLGRRRRAGEDHLSRRRHARADGRRGRSSRAARTPKAAKAFVDYINRKDVREMIITETFRRPARQDLDLAKLPGSMPALSSLKLLPYKEEAWTAVRAADARQDQGHDPGNPLSSGGRAVEQDRDRRRQPILRIGGRRPRRLAGHRGRRVLHAARPVRLRQDHAAAHDRRLHRARCRPDPHRRASASTRCRRIGATSAWCSRTTPSFPT